MAAALKLAKEWDNPRIPIEAPPSKMSIIASISDSTPTINCDLYDELIESVVGPPHQTNSSRSSSTSQSRVSIDDIDEACAKLLTLL